MFFLKQNERKIKTILIEFIGQYPKPFVLLFTLLIIQSAIAAISVLTLIPLADYVLDPSLAKASKITQILLSILKDLNVRPSFLTFGLIFITWNLLNSALEVLVFKSILGVKYGVTKGLFSDVLGQFFRARGVFFSNTDHGLILNTLSKELNTISEALGQLSVLLSKIVQLSIYLVIPLMLNYKVTLLTLSLAVFFIIPFIGLKKLSYELGKQNADTANRSLSILNEILTNSRLVISYGRQLIEKNRFLDAFGKHSRVTIKQQTLNAGLPKLFYSLGVIAVLISIGFGIQDNSAISELAALMWSLMAVVPILSSFFHGNITINNFIPSYEQLMRLRADAVRNEETPGGVGVNYFSDSIEFKSVCFSYPDRQNVLQDINMSLPKGSITALVGESGAGKSTISDLILGLQKPTSGHILIDNVNYEDIYKNSFRELIGYVPQDPVLFTGTIRDNMKWSNPVASEKDIWDALTAANAKNFIEALPNGLDTLVGDRGSRLSGGQRQRVALARAFVRKPQLLILDEATSALDTESEREIQASIESVSKDVTILIISHRLSTISIADQIIVIGAGKIQQIGSFANLSADKTGRFFQLLDSKVSSSEDLD